MIYVPFPTLCFDHFLEANYPSRAIFWSAKIEPPMRKSEKQFLDLGRDLRCPEFPADAGADGNCKKRWIPIGSEGRSILSPRETPWVPKFRLWKKVDSVWAKFARRCVRFPLFGLNTISFWFVVAVVLGLLSMPLVDVQNGAKHD